MESAKTEEKAIAAWGMSVRNVTRAYLREARMPYLKGVLVTGTQSGSAAETAQITRGDIILKVDNKPVANADELEAAVAEWQKHPKPIEVVVRRDRGPRDARDQALIQAKENALRVSGECAIEIEDPSSMILESSDAVDGKSGSGGGSGGCGVGLGRAARMGG